jgi:hypothetical protein
MAKLKWGFRKSVKVAPGVRLNVGRKSLGASFGGKGLRYSINSKRKPRISASIPKTGLNFSADLGNSTKRKGRNSHIVTSGEPHHSSTRNSSRYGTGPKILLWIVVAIIAIGAARQLLQ